MIVTQSEYLAFIQAASGVTIPASGQTLLTTCGSWVQAQIERIIGYKLPAAETTVTEYYPETVTNYAAGNDGGLVGGWDLRGGRMADQIRGDQSGRLLTVRSLPLRSVTSIYENLGAWDTAGGTWPASSLLATNDYYIDQYQGSISETGRIIRAHGVWAKELRTIKVTYVYGLTQAEIDADWSDLKLLVCESLQAFLIGTVIRSKAAKAGGMVTSESITDFSQSFATPEQMGVYFKSNYTLPPEVVSRLGPFCNLRRYF